MLINTHYRQKLNFSTTRLDEAQKAVNRLREFYSKLTEYSGSGPEDAQRQVETAEQQFTTAMDDDLNISGGLAAIFEIVRWGNRAMVEGELNLKGAQEILDLMDRFDHVLGVLKMESGLVREIDDAFVQAKITERKQARADRDFAASDAIRDELADLGVELIDTPDGTKWKMK